MISKFNTGEIRVTPGAQRLNINLRHYLKRHIRGDWGDGMSKDDWKANDQNMLRPDGSLYSAYETSVGRLFIITYVGEFTTILTPSEI